jgi:hypothetical protein
VNREQFKSLLEDLHHQEQVLNSTKGVEYAEADDVLANFRSTADDIDMPLRKVLYTHMHKHWSAIKYYCNTGRLESTETLGGRVNDLRLYLALLRVTQIAGELSGEEENWLLEEIEKDGANF